MVVIWHACFLEKHRELRVHINGGRGNSARDPLNKILIARIYILYSSSVYMYLSVAIFACHETIKEQKITKIATY